jgi:hypothetical protein
LMGRSNKGNLIFKEGINEVKITRKGDIIWIVWFTLTEWDQTSEEIIYTNLSFPIL